MQTSQKKVTREKFIDVVNLATDCINNRYPQSKLSQFCNEFLKLNKKTMKSHDKKVGELTNDLQLELRLFRAKHAIEKEGKLLLTDNGAYQFNSDGEQQIIKKEAEVNKKITAILDEILEEEVEVVCVLEKVPLPKAFLDSEFFTLNGFVFKNEFVCTDEKA